MNDRIVPNSKRIAYFVSPHGFGHAARAAAVMEAFIQKHMSGVAVDESEFTNGNWTDRLDDMLALPHAPSGDTNGAE